VLAVDIAVAVVASAGAIHGGLLGSVVFHVGHPTTVLFAPQVQPAPSVTLSAVDPALYAQVKAAALRFCRQVAAEGLPWDEALGEVRREIATERGKERQEELQALELVLGVVHDCAELGRALGGPPQPTLQTATVEGPATGASVALPGGL